MILLMWKVMAVIYFANDVYCGTIQRSIDVGKKGKGRIVDEKLDRCPLENSDVPVYLAHPDDCSKFYICDSGTPHLKSCQPGLHFNPAVNTCDYPKNAGCNKIVGTKGKDRTVDEKFDSCILENSDVPIYLAHPNDCSKFYICDSGMPHLKSCQPGLHFNPAVNACDYPESARCNKNVGTKGKDRIVIEKFDSCPLKNSDVPVYLTHPDDCSKFYICDSGTPHLKSCQPGLHFNSIVNACDYPKNAGCEESSSEKPKGRMVGDDLPACPVENSDFPTFLPHPHDCQKFYVCEKGTPHLEKCPPGLHFNVKINVCDYPRNAGCSAVLKGVEVQMGERMVNDDLLDSCPLQSYSRPLFVPHPGKCEKYSICYRGRRFSFTCPSGLHFNPKEEACDFPQNTDCDEKMWHIRAAVPSPFCPPMDGKSPVFFRHSTNCTVYYMCGNGLAHQFTCPARLHFNLRKKQCDYEENANCQTVDP